MPGWNSFKTNEPFGLSAELTTFTGGGGDEIGVYIARPTGGGKHPALLAIHHMPGWDEFFQEFAERLARHGYIVIVPDLYSRFGHGTPDDVAARVRSLGGVHDSAVLADARAALEWIRAQPDWNGKAGVLGTCSGGRHALLIASCVPGFDAVVDLWGGGVVATGQENEARPVPPIQYTEQLTVPLLGIFGNDDKSPTPAQVDEHEAELKRLQKNYEFHRYDGAGHGFFYYHNAMYRAEQAMDAWAKIFKFFERELAAG